MGHIHPQKMEISVEELTSLAAWLQNIHEQITQLRRDQSAAAAAAGGADPAAGSAEVIRHLQEAEQILFREIAGIRQDADILFQCAQIYRRAQEKTCAIYSGEYIVTPRTEFGRSRFENLDVFREILRVYPDDRSEGHLRDAGTGGTHSGKETIPDHHDHHASKPLGGIF